MSLKITKKIKVKSSNHRINIKVDVYVNQIALVCPQWIHVLKHYNST